MRLTPASNKRISPVSSKHVYLQKKNLLATFKSCNVFFLPFDFKAKWPVCYKIFFCGNHWCLLRVTNQQQCAGERSTFQSFRHKNRSSDLAACPISPAFLRSHALRLHTCVNKPSMGSVSFKVSPTVIPPSLPTIKTDVTLYDAAILNHHIWLTNGNSSRSNSAN